MSERTRTWRKEERRDQNVTHVPGAVPQRRGPIRLRELVSGTAPATGAHLQRDLAAHQPARRGASTPASASQGEYHIYIYIYLQCSLSLERSAHSCFLLRPFS